MKTHKYSPKTDDSWSLGLEVCAGLMVANKMESMPTAVIAAACECSETAIYHVEQRALRKLRAGLAAKIPGLFAPDALATLLGPEKRRKYTNKRRNLAL